MPAGYVRRSTTPCSCSATTGRSTCRPSPTGATAAPRAGAAVLARVPCRARARRTCSCTWPRATRRRPGAGSRRLPSRACPRAPRPDRTRSAAPVPSHSVPFGTSLRANPLLSQWVRLRRAGTGRVEVRVGKVELGQGIVTALGQIAAEELDVGLVPGPGGAREHRREPRRGLHRRQPVGHGLGQRRCARSARSSAAAPAAASARPAPAPAESLRRRTTARSCDASGRRRTAATGASLRRRGPGRGGQRHGPAPRTRPCTQVVGHSVPRPDLDRKLTGAPAFVHDLRAARASCSAGWSGRPPPAPACSGWTTRPRGRCPPCAAWSGTAASSASSPTGEEEAIRAAELLRGRSPVAGAGDAARGARTGSSGSSGSRPRTRQVDAAGGPGRARPASVDGHRATYGRPTSPTPRSAPGGRRRPVGRRRRLGVDPHARASTRCGGPSPPPCDLDPERVTVAARGGRRLLRPQQRRRRRLRRGAARPRRARPAGPGGVVPRGRVRLGALQPGDGGGGRRRASMRPATWSPGGSTPGATGTTAARGSSVSPGCSPPGTPTTSPVPAAADPAAGHRRGHRAQRGPGLRRRGPRRAGAPPAAAPLRTSALRGARRHGQRLRDRVGDGRARRAGRRRSARVPAAAPRRRARPGRAPDRGGARPAGPTAGARTASGWGVGLRPLQGRLRRTAPWWRGSRRCRRSGSRDLWVAVDAGQVINPDGLANQVEGGAIQATSWTLQEEVTFDARTVTSRDWEGYPILRFGEVPRVHVDAAPPAARSAARGGRGRGWPGRRGARQRAGRRDRRPGPAPAADSGTHRRGHRGELMPPAEEVVERPGPTR